MNRTVILGENLPDVAHLAIGYLSTWSFTSYDLVRIIPDNSFGSKENLITYYEDTSNGKLNTGRTFVISAIWDKDKKQYSFHS